MHTAKSPRAYYSTRAVDTGSPEIANEGNPNNGGAKVKDLFSKIVIGLRHII